jgi:hypothetical protein
MAQVALEEKRATTAHDFDLLEDRIRRAVDMLRAERKLRAAAVAEQERLRVSLADEQRRAQGLAAQVVGLKRTREQARVKVEKMLEQIDEMVGE